MRLSVQIEFDKTLDLETQKTTVTVGRSPKCDLVIPHDAISREHCRIEFQQGHYYITDLGSSNGVSIDGQRLPPHERRPFLSSQHLCLGSIECEIGQSQITPSDGHKILSSSVDPGGDFTATVRLARLDLNRPSKPLELQKVPKIEKPQTPSRPRNPITSPLGPPPKVQRSSSGTLLFIFVAILVVTFAWLLSPE